MPYTGEDMFGERDGGADEAGQPATDTDPADPAADPGDVDHAEAGPDRAEGGSDLSETGPGQADDSTGTAAGEADLPGDPGEYAGAAVA